MGLQSVTVSVGSNPIALGSNPLGQGRSRVIVSNMGGAGSGIIYLGDSLVTAASGLALASNAAPLTVDTPNGDTLWAISNSGVQTVKVLEVA